MKATRMPVLFLGHGSPMNTLEDNRYTRAWRTIGQALPRPTAILAFSAHWYVPELAVTAMEMPRTIHDFGGFPQALFDFQYPAAGSPALAGRVQDLLQSLKVAADQSWGLDHGTWSVLAHLFPAADIPVVQLSIDRNQAHSFHYRLGQLLAPLRDEGVLILGSGNIVHNLAAINWDEDSPPYDWAVRFEERVKERLRQRDHAALIDYPQLDREAQLAVPTAEHYLPLLPVLGALRDDDEISFPVSGIHMGSLSMLSVLAGNSCANS
ncbi:MAG: 4,5-DOPA dioxygenase extradiol [Rhodocyclaceae bacterium]|nr:MAG: 4,5-DOPA dioxygenase extradiol [Rhodocyclaceae bacterium]